MGCFNWATCSSILQIVISSSTRKRLKKKNRNFLFLKNGTRKYRNVPQTNDLWIDLNRFISLHTPYLQINSQLQMIMILNYTTKNVLNYIRNKIRPTFKWWVMRWKRKENCFFSFKLSMLSCISVSKLFLAVLLSQWHTELNFRISFTAHK